MFTKLRFAAGKDLVVPFQKADPGVSSGALGINLGKELDREIMRDPDVVRVAEIVLQPFQLSDEFLQIVLIKQACAKFNRVAELLGGDSHPVPLARRQPAKPFAAPPQFSPPPIEPVRRELADQRARTSGCFGFRAVTCFAF